MAILLMILSWAIFYSLHTALAASKLKRFLEAKWPDRMKWYRLLYSLFSTLLFMGILIQALFLPVQVLFTKNPIISYAGYMIATLGVVLITRSIKKISLPAFLGLLSERTTITESLQVSGIYARVRHPLYLGLLLIFFGYFLVAGTVGALVHLSCLVVYLPFGIYFEEKNLIERYRNNYQRYREEVPALFPAFFKKKRA
ncbi:isoprenylcysteine carboxylmethyltransferase family protein [Algoriphagus sp. AK58]|uniref:methyltransferase family protein n=1 Tax=Algoriphagus sp. AK58 TaxID=1406877 RepID=UPI0016504651|nr:isoprenylcysteine carboxylmethyltransferase family protein [Algoriphagus sp. AK58]MBC6365526.1 protein-S-isoprenylcysteine methyltransferase [Algoriphagus sp. AK58]